MRRYIQQVGSELVGWFLALFGTVVYLLTMETSVSLWDCGEFIATNWMMGIGHPPGAPFYQLLAHVFCLFAGDDMTRIAWWSNALSAVAGGFTVAFLYWTLLMLMGGGRKKIPALAATIGSLCYLFCDTAWFSAVESEVYSLAMLLASVSVWAMMRWYYERPTAQASRWLCLEALVLGLSVCVHLMCWLTIPALLLIYLWKRVTLKKAYGPTPWLRNGAFIALFFVIGLSPMLLIPLRAQAHPVLNEGDPSTCESMKRYLQREQYAKAPLYPRIWRVRDGDETYYASWCRNHAARQGKPLGDSFLDNMEYFFSYQLGYMYGRYLMWNFSGRYNDRNGYGSLQNGQFITGIPLIDKMLVGTGQTPPKSLHTESRNVYFLLPLLLGIVGFLFLYRYSRRGFWQVLLLFLFGGPLLAVYLNMPAYEPRERDYVFVLSFYAFAIYIAFGALRFLLWTRQRSQKRWALWAMTLLLVGVPSLMVAQNMDDHDRSNRTFARDYARNYLNSCASNSILLTYGDNDTFPLWYLQYVEQQRRDVQVINLSLLSASWYQRQMDEQLREKGYVGLDIPEEGLSSYRALMQIVSTTPEEHPLYLSHYAYREYRHLFANRLALSGYAYRIAPPESADTVDAQAFARKILTDSLHWNSLDDAYVDWTSQKLLDSYWRNVVTLADNLMGRGDAETAVAVLEATEEELPLSLADDLTIADGVATLYRKSNRAENWEKTDAFLRKTLREQMAYYQTMSPQMQQYIPYTLESKEKLWQRMQ